MKLSNFVVSNFEFTLCCWSICHHLQSNLSHSRLGVGLVHKPSPSRMFQKKTEHSPKYRAWRVKHLIWPSWVSYKIQYVKKTSSGSNNFKFSSSHTFPTSICWAQLLHWRLARRWAARRPPWCPARPQLRRRPRRRLDCGECATNTRRTCGVVHGIITKKTRVLYGRYAMYDMWYMAYGIWYVTHNFTYTYIAEMALIWYVCQG